MSQENVEIVRRIFALNSREFSEDSFELMAPDFELDMSDARGPYRGVLGRTAAQRFFREFIASWESFVQDAEFIDAGDRVVTPFVIRPQGRSGIEVAATGTYVWTIQDGLVAHLRLYQDRAEALEAVGLSE